MAHIPGISSFTITPQSFIKPAYSAWRSASCFNCRIGCCVLCQGIWRNICRPLARTPPPLFGGRFEICPQGEGGVRGRLVNAYRNDVVCCCLPFSWGFTCCCNRLDGVVIRTISKCQDCNFCRRIWLDVAYACCA